MSRIGIDLGGTKIEGARLEADGTIAARERVETPREDYKGTLRAIADLVGQLEGDDGPLPVGVGHPGSVSPATGWLGGANSTWLNLQPLEKDLGALLGERPLRLANDANCFALSEAIDGAAADAHTVFGVILGTGVGGALVVDGKLIAGRNNIAGEWGHNSLPFPREDEVPGPRCWTGRQGCIESFLSGPGLADDHERVTGEKLTPEGIVAAAAARSLEAETTLRRYEHRLARALASIINVFDPEVIVLGGGISNLDRLYKAVPMLWREFAFTDRVQTELRAPKHGDSSGVLGAARLNEL